MSRSLQTPSLSSALRTPSRVLRLAPLYWMLGACAVGPVADLDPRVDAPVVDAPVDAPVDEPVETDITPTEEVWQISGERTASGTLVPAAGGRGFVVADAELGALQLARLGSGDVVTIDVQGEATRLVRIGDTLAVTLREEGEVALFRWADGVHEAGPRRVVGTEPFDVVASRLEAKLYVSLSIDDAVVELDAATLTELRRWTVRGEPRWMAVRDTGAGEELLVTSARGGSLQRIDLHTGTMTALELPVLPRFTDEACPQRDLISRVTGELTLGERGDSLFVPALYVDPLMDETSDPLGPCGTGSIIDGLYGDMAELAAPGAPGRFNPAVVVFDLSDPSVAPMPVALGSVLTDYSALEPVQVVRSTPTSVLVAPEFGEDAWAFVTLEGSDSVVVIDIGQAERDPTSPLLAWARSAIPMESNLTNLRFDPADTSWLWGWSVTDRGLRAYERGEMELIHRETADFAGLGFPFSAIEFSGPETVVQLPESTLPEDVQRGRAMFYDALDTTLSAPGAGVSCSSCHVDGRSDGITWQFEDFARNTPSLAGPVSDSAPLTWTGDVDSVVDHILTVATERMGGRGISVGTATDLAAFVDYTRDVMSPETVDRALVAAGRTVYDSQGCAGCHVGDRGADGQLHELFGVAVDTPVLVGLAGSAPYLHDGSAETLRDVVDVHSVGLGSADKAALAAYLRSM